MGINLKPYSYDRIKSVLSHKQPNRKEITTHTPVSHRCQGEKGYIIYLCNIWTNIDLIGMRYFNGIFHLREYERVRNHYPP